MIRLDKYLHDLGLGTRKEIHDLIKKKNIKVNEQIVVDVNKKIKENDKVSYLDKELNYTKYLYLMLHKPQGYVTTTEGTDNSIMNLIKEYDNYHLFPIGRLDKDTTGLILFTNDGEFSHNLIHPKKHIDKTYYVEIDKPLSIDELKDMSQGINGDKLKTKPCEIKKDGKGYLLTIYEGQYHQIKRMMAYYNKQVTRLHRTKIGSLILDIPLGQNRLLTDEEINNLKNK